VCECEALPSVRHTYLSSFFLDSGDVIGFYVWRPSGVSVKEQGCYVLASEYRAQSIGHKV